MRRSGKGSGGGIGMNKHRDVRAPKAEPRARAMSPAAVNQLGAKVGDHVTHQKGSTRYTGEKLVRGAGYNAPGMISNPVKAVGVGGGRTIYSCGSQGTQGSVSPGNPPPNPRRDALEGE